MRSKPGARRVYEIEAWRRLPTTSSILLPSVVVARTRRSISISIDLRKQWEVDAPVFKELGRKLESCLVWSLLASPGWTQAIRQGELRVRGVRFGGNTVNEPVSWY
jgi:hypothetical protein